MAVSSVGMFGDGITQGRSGRVPIHVARPALHRHDFELGADAVMLVEQPRKLGNGHAVAHRHAELADEGLKPRLQRRPFDLDAADRIRPVADDDRYAVTRRGAQAVRHGVDEGVDAGADVLQVDDEHVDELEHLLGRLARLAVEREDRARCGARSLACGVSIMLSCRSER